jgi:hypothetical protein
MRLTEEELKKLYQQQAACPARGRAECLTEEDLLRAAVGELNNSERGRMADHLLSCSDCIEEYRLTISLKPLAEQIADIKVKMPRIEPWALGSKTQVRVFRAVAASLLFITVLLSGWTLFLLDENSRVATGSKEKIAEMDRAIAGSEESLAKARRQLEEVPKLSEKYENEIAQLRKNIDDLSKPQINVPIYDLDPKDSVRGESQEAITIKVPPGTYFFTLILNTAGEHSFPVYGVEILDRRGSLVWQGNGLQKSSSNNFTIALSRRLFSAGKYRIRLYGLNGGRKRYVEDYSARILY